MRVIWRGSVYTVIDTGEHFGEPWYLLRYEWNGVVSLLTRWVPARLTKVAPAPVEGA